MAKKMKNPNPIIFVAIVLFSLNIASSCEKNPSINLGDEVTFKENKEDFCNPERGYYHQYSLKFTDGKLPNPIIEKTLKANRVSNRSLSLTLFYLTDFLESEISADALEVIKQSFQAHRTGGCKAIVRFAYRDSDKDSSGKLYDPYEPTVEMTLKHVEQIKPILQEYADVIYVMQAGFIGAWGEWYYTTNFTFNPVNDKQFADRRKLVRALLDALPTNRQLALRTPFYKMKILQTSLADTITAATAFSATDVARIGGHNDCFISSSSDVGTYYSKEDRDLWAAETNYTIMGGETCTGDPKYCGCEPADRDLRKYHWSYLNHAYHSGTFENWKASGCFDELSKSLGYRLCLKKAWFKYDFATSNDMKITIEIQNQGFASLINARKAEFVVYPSDNIEDITIYPLNVDPRTWKAGNTYQFSQTITLPELVVGKEYTICLNFPDESVHLTNNPDFSVRLANKSVWIAEKGYNKLYTFVAQ